MKKFGIIGGLSLTASNNFLQKFNSTFAKKTKAYRNFDFPEFSLFSKGFDYRNKDQAIAILSPFFEYLKKEKYDFWVCPCNSFHFIFAEITARFNLQGISLIETVTEKVLQSSAKKVLVLSAKNEQKNELYKKCFSAKNHEKEILFLDEQETGILRSIILNTKGNTLSKEDLKTFIKVTEPYSEVDGIVLGCTELPVFHDQFQKNFPEHFANITFFDSNQILAEKVTEIL